MKFTFPLATVLLFASASLARAADVPRSVEELWSDFDPRKDALETEVFKEWREEGMVFRNVRFVIAEIKGKKTRLAGIYGFPDGSQGRLPAVLQIHGGGGKARLDEVKYLAARGYAVLSVNWGGANGKTPTFNRPDTFTESDPNTEWGEVDPTQMNAGRYSSMLPGPKQFFEDREHPKNNNWYLLTMACRRALTFLEQQTEVDPSRLGVHGYSMGGNLTMYVAGTDRRVKAAVPGVGGQGWRWQKHPFFGGDGLQDNVQGDVDVFRRTLSFESYAPLIRCPVLHRSGTNDFHGWMDDVYRTNALIPDQETRYSWSIHQNHALLPEVAVTMPLWLDHYLKGGPALPSTPASKLTLKPVDGVPVFEVAPQGNWPVARCEIYYSVDPEPRGRFWRSTQIERNGDTFRAKLPLHDTKLPLFAFANVFYTLPKPESAERLGSVVQVNGPITEVCLSTLLHSADVTALELSGVKASESTSLVIEDFKHGNVDWMDRRKSGWMNSTRKVADPKWKGPEGSNLALTVNLPKTNHIVVTLTENEWRNYRGPKKIFVCDKEVVGDPGSQTVLFALSDFKNQTDGAPLKSWSQLDVLAIGPNSTKPWSGAAPELLQLAWRP